MSIRNFHESSRRIKESSIVRRGVTPAVIGALAGLLTYGVAEHKESDRESAARLHASVELSQFGQKDYASKYLEDGVNPEDVTVVTVSDYDKSPFSIANGLGAKDLAVVAEEIYNQLGGKINTGDVAVIPNDQLDINPRRLA